MRRVRVGIIGAGMVSQIAHLPVLASDSSVELTSITDVRPDLAQLVAKKFDIPHVYPNHTKLLANENLDLVFICVHRNCATSVISEALDSGHCVFSEKPIGFSSNQISSLIAKAEASSTFLQVGYMRRFDAGVAMFRKVLENWLVSEDQGPLLGGSIRDFCPKYAVSIPAHIRVDSHRSYEIDEWATRPTYLPLHHARAHDVWTNVISHDLNLLRFLMRPQSTAVCSMSSMSDQMQSAILDWDGTPVTIQAGKSDSGRWDQSFEFLFQGGRLILNLPSSMDVTAHASIQKIVAGETVEETVPTPQRTFFEAQMDNLIENVRLGYCTQNSASEALEDMRVIEELWRKHPA
jgi:predicted dehydrogenase